MKVFAKDLENPVLDSSIRGLSGLEFASKLVSLVFGLLILGGFLFFFFQIIMAGYTWITSQGNKDGVEKARNQLIYAFLGLFVVFSVFAIAKVVGYVFGLTGLEKLQIDLPTL
ncbi:MAG: hypothetical protein ABID04_04280 [Patescibacteria group bacterium]